MSLHRAAPDKGETRKSSRRSPRADAAATAAGSASHQAKQLAGEISKSLAHGHIDALTPEAIQALMAALSRLYAAQAEAGAAYLPIGARSAVTATDAMVVASGLLKAVNLAVFELGMWQSWTGR